MDPETPARDQVLVRSLQPQDLEVVIAIDASILGRRLWRAPSRWMSWPVPPARGG